MCVYKMLNFAIISFFLADTFFLLLIVHHHHQDHLVLNEEKKSNRHKISIIQTGNTFSPFDSFSLCLCLFVSIDSIQKIWISTLNVKNYFFFTYLLMFVQKLIEGHGSPLASQKFVVSKSIPISLSSFNNTNGVWNVMIFFFFFGKKIISDNFFLFYNNKHQQTNSHGHSFINFYFWWCGFRNRFCHRQTKKNRIRQAFVYL